MKVLAIITGILMIILGFGAVAMPLRVFLGMGWVLGILILVNGIELIVKAFYKKKDIWQCILGILIAIAGGIMIFNVAAGLMVDALLAYLAGFAIIVYGIYMIIAAIARIKQSVGIGVLGIICGILSIIAGGFCVLHPVLTMISLGYLIAFSVVMEGINMIVIACAVEKENKTESDE